MRISRFEGEKLFLSIWPGSWGALVSLKGQHCFLPC